MEPLDWKALRENCAGDEGLVNEVLDLFRNEAGGMLADVGTAVKSGDPVTIKRAAHRLKGALVSLAAKPATEAAKALELAGSSSNLAAAPALFAQLEAELTRVLDTIAQPHTA